MANPILQLLEALRNMFTCDIGIDLGTANTLVYMKGRGIIIREPSVVAVDARTDELRVRCVGHEAKAIIGAAPNSILAVRPLKDGVIADFDITAAMLQSFIRQACGSRLFVRPRVVICVPSGVTEVERRAVRQAAAKAGARQVTVIEEPMAAAIGAGLPTAEPVGSMIVDIGGGTAEVAVISLSGIVASRSVRCAGDALDQSITSFIKRKYNLLVGERTAEQIKLEIGSACPPDPTDTEHGETTMEIKGRNLVDGLPKDILIRSEEVREAMNENLMRIVEAIKDTLECTPPELSSDIIDRGIMLSGGGALLRGLDTLIQNETGIEVHIAEAPLDCVCPRCRRRPRSPRFGRKQTGGTELPVKVGVRAIPHNSKCRYGERGAADAKPKAQIILDAAKVSAASGGNSEPKQGQRSQSARGFCPRSTMRVPQPDIIEHFGNADAVPQLPERCLSR